MFLAHSIRLRDPWQCEPTEQGGVRWTRRFHRPTGLEPDDQLLLVLSGLPADAVVTVNGQSFALPTSIVAPPASPQPAQFDLTSILADGNEIAIDVPADPLRRLVEPRLEAAFPFDARLAIIGHS